jgi:hypothetical protein
MSDLELRQDRLRMDDGEFGVISGSSLHQLGVQSNVPRHPKNKSIVAFPTLNEDSYAVVIGIITTFLASWRRLAMMATCLGDHLLIERCVTETIDAA